MKYVQMIYQVVSDDGVVFLEHKYRMPAEPCKHSTGRVVPSFADREAGRFWEKAVLKGVLSLPAPRDASIESHGRRLGLHPL